MIATYKVLSALLSYPTAELQMAAPELQAALDGEQLLPADHRAAIGALIEDIASGDLVEIQSRYVDLFDRTRSLSLHLFEHVHGESRDRGQAMVSLLERYNQAGLDVAARELPDFIPLFLEFLATRTIIEARADLAEPAHILVALGERLRQRGSAYACVLEALAVLSEARPDRAALERLRGVKIEDPANLAELDQVWEEAEVRFGPGDAAAESCPRVESILRAMDVASPPMGDRG